MNAEGAPEDSEEVDTPMCLAELAAVLLGFLGFLILVSGLGFFTVHPPGEDDLCQIKVLGLQNKTKSDQDFALGTCHALYGGVFNMLHAISIPFILCGALAMASAYAVGRGAMARHPETTPSYFKCGLCTNLGGLVMVFIPTMVFPSLTGIVAAGLAPIHAYFITIMVGHFAVDASGVASTSNQDADVRAAAQAYETLYLGYCAASRVELCLFVGSMSMIVLFWIYIVDMARGVAAITCKPPNYANAGCQLCRAHRLMRAKKDQGVAMYNQVAPAGSP